MWILLGTTSTSYLTLIITMCLALMQCTYSSEDHDTVFDCAALQAIKQHHKHGLLHWSLA